jgi:flagellar basal-body rod modification protein FlgD
MTYISEIYQAPSASSSAADTEKSNTLGQDDFLTLLVAQLQNQDPLNPSDPTEFTSQLAQFSELEQLFNLNDSMDNLAEAQNNAEKLSALSLIGKKVLVEGSEFVLEEEGPVEIGYTVDGQASDITITIQNENYETVARLSASELGHGNHFIQWNGVGSDGEQLPAGKYRITITAQSANEDGTVGVTPLVHAKVTGVDLNDGAATLITEIGEYSINDVNGVYDSDDESMTGGSEEGENTSTAASSSASETLEGDGVDYSANATGDLDIDFTWATSDLEASRENLPMLAAILREMGYDATVFNQASASGSAPIDKLEIGGRVYDVLAVEESPNQWNSSPVLIQ